MPMSSPSFALILHGATGFTGQLVAEFLDQEAQRDLSWAIAGRNRAKLEALQARLKSRPAVLIADSQDGPSVDALVKQAKVLCTTVGPYSRYGTPILSACARRGVDYCDLSGEIPWIARSIESFHEEARRSGSRIVHSCGYDAVPFDLGVYLTQRKALEKFQVPCRSVSAGLIDSKGGLSGGTLASILEVMREAQGDEDIATLLRDPICLQRNSGWQDDSARSEQRGIRHRPGFGWTGPHLMAPINLKIVRRSQCLLPETYGRAFEYDEFVSFGPGLRGHAKARLMSAALKAFSLALQPAPIRSRLVGRLLPKPGEGPGRAARESGFFRLGLRGRGISPRGAPFHLETLFQGQGDPGYAATSRMLGTVALCLATGQLEHPSRYGVLTPAASIGLSLIEPLRKRGFSIESKITQGD